MTYPDYEALREATGLTQMQVAALTRVSESEIASWESGNRQPDKKDAARLMAVLKTHGRRFDHPAFRGERR